MKTLLLIAVTTLCLANTESRIPIQELKAAEGSLNDRFKAPSADAYHLLGTARGSYLPGYGALLTVEMELVFVPIPSAFRQPYTPKEIAVIHDRKIKKLPELKETMRDVMANACSQLDALPLNEHISIEAFLWRYSWEDSHGLPQRIFMTAEKQKLLQAQAAHVDLSTVIEEQER